MAKMSLFFRQQGQAFEAAMFEFRPHEVSVDALTATSSVALADNRNIG